MDVWLVDPHVLYGHTSNVTVRVSVDSAKYTVIVLFELMVPLVDDHLSNVYPDAGVAVMSVPAIVRTFSDVVNVVPAGTVIDD